MQTFTFTLKEIVGETLYISFVLTQTQGYRCLGQN